MKKHILSLVAVIMVVAGSAWGMEVLRGKAPPDEGVSGKRIELEQQQQLPSVQMQVGETQPLTETVQTEVLEPSAVGLIQEQKVFNPFGWQITDIIVPDAESIPGSEIVGQSTSGQSTQNIEHFDVSSDGRYVVFQSKPDDLGLSSSDDDNVYVYDRVTDSLIEAAQSNLQTNSGPAIGGNCISYQQASLLSDVHSDLFKIIGATVSQNSISNSQIVGDPYSSTHDTGNTAISDNCQYVAYVARQMLGADYNVYRVSLSASGQPASIYVVSYVGNQSLSSSNSDYFIPSVGSSALAVSDNGDVLFKVSHYKTQWHTQTEPYFFVFSAADAQTIRLEVPGVHYADLSPDGNVIVFSTKATGPNTFGNKFKTYVYSRSTNNALEISHGLNGDAIHPKISGLTGPQGNRHYVVVFQHNDIGGTGITVQKALVPENFHEMGFGNIVPQLLGNGSWPKSSSDGSILVYKGQDRRIYAAPLP